MKSKLSILLVAFCTIANAQWQQTSGPTGGYISSFAVSGTNIFAGSLAGGGVFRSSDNGNSWISVDSGLTFSEITSLVVKDTNLFAGTYNSDGVYRSTNNGSSWILMQNGFPSTSVVSLAVIGNTVFAGTNDDGIYRSSDNGVNWTAANNGLPCTPSNCNAPFFVKDGNSLYVGFNNGIYLSTDTGASWVSVGIFGNDVKSFAVSGTNLFVGIWTDGVYRSTDGGAHWTYVNALNTGSFAVIGSTVFAGTYNKGVFVSSDNGNTWNAANIGISHNEVFAMMVNGADLFIGTENGIFKSSNNGGSWANVNNGLIATEVLSLVVKGNNLFAGTRGGGVFFTQDSGASWIAMNSGLNNETVSALAVNGSNIFAGTTNNGYGNDTCLWLSTNNGSSWSASNSGIISNNVSAIAVNGNNLFAGTGGAGVYLSTNNGNSWTPIDLGFTYGSSTYVYSLFVNGTNLFAGAEDVYRSTNNGSSWTSSHLNANESSFACNGTTLFAATYGYGVFFSSDNGNTWTSSLNTGLTNQYILSLACYGNYLFAGTENGVFLSTNNGANWTAVNAGIDSLEYNRVVNSLCIMGKNIFAGTHNSGVYRASICSLTNLKPSVISGKASCNGINDYSASVSISGGNPPYNYLWSNGQTSTAINNLMLGTYSITVTDSIGCSTSSYVAITQAQPLNADAGADEKICFGSCTSLGASSVAIGGSPPFSYLWSPTTGLNSTSLPNPTACLTTVQSYTISIIDSHGCVAGDSIHVGINPLPVVSFSGLDTVYCNALAQINLVGSPTGGLFSGAGMSGTIFNPALAGPGTHNIIYTYTDSNSCIASSSQLTTVLTGTFVPSICIVTADSLSKYNIIAWDDTLTSNIDSIIVYREITGNHYKPIAELPHNGIREFVDTVKTKYFPSTGDPLSGIQRYKIGAKMNDSCGSYSLLSPYHSTIFVNQFGGGTFGWNQYQIEGQTIPLSEITGYFLFRDSIGNGNWKIVDSVLSSQTSIIDYNYSLFPNGKWRVEAKWGNTCVTGGPTYNHAISNIAVISTLQVAPIFISDDISLYPNPTTGIFSIKSTENISLVEIHNLLGEKVYQSIISNSQFQIDISSQSIGIYFLKITSQNGSSEVKKIIKE